MQNCQDNHHINRHTKNYMYIIRSTAFAVLQLVITMFFVMSITFFIAHLIPGSPFYSSGKGTSNIVTETLTQNTGLGDNVFTQYIRFLKELFTFNFGDSLIHSGVEVKTIVFNALGASLQVGVTAVILSLISVTLITQLISFLKQNKYINVVLGVIGTTIPTFVFSILFQWLFCLVLRIAPPFWDKTFLGSLPAVFSLSIYPTCYMVMILSDAISDELDKLYCKLLLLRGKRKTAIVRQHALPNAIPSIIGAAVPLYTNILMGSFIVEKVFAISGIGWYFIESITNRDYPTILGLTFFFSLFFIVVTITTDAIYLSTKHRSST